MKPYYQDKWVTIYHGDCREVLPQLDVKVDLVLTDPPYNSGLKYSGTQNDNRPDYWEWLQDRLNPCRQMATSVLVKHTSRKIRDFQAIWDSQIIVWVKPFSSGFPYNGLLLHWEPIHLIQGKAIHAMKDYIVASSGNCNKEYSSGHIAQYPEILGLPLIVAFTEPGQSVLDPFLGSGTTCYCAKKLNRYSIGIEIEERYCEIAARRCSQDVMVLR